jgi:hypothetical protein
MGAEADEYNQFTWMNEYPTDETDLQPRNFIEQRGMLTWGEPILRHAPQNRGGTHCGQHA